MTARRITITVDEGIADAEALEAVREVVGRGRISGMEKDTYCYATIMRTVRNRLAVYAWRTLAGNDAFRVSLSERRA